MMKTTIAAAAGHAAASLCFTLRAGQYNVLAASLANNIKPWFWCVVPTDSPRAHKDQQTVVVVLTRS
jgi:hypothetical protein